MSLLTTLVEINNAERLESLNRRLDDTIIPGDFEGSVTGIWVKFADNGGGLVRYNNKEYMTKPLGNASIPPGTEVELSHANGVYFSKF